MDAVTGRLVKSTAGRDKGRFFVIAAVLDDNHVLIVDGDLRKADKPKRKKLKHLVITTTVFNDFEEKVRKAENTLNAEIRKLIASVAN